MSYSLTDEHILWIVYEYKKSGIQMDKVARRMDCSEEQAWEMFAAACKIYGGTKKDVIAIATAPKILQPVKDGRPPKAPKIPKPPKVRKEKIIKPVVEKIKATGRLPKVELPKYSTKQRDYSSMKLVRVDEKTSVYVEGDADPEIFHQAPVKNIQGGG